MSSGERVDWRRRLARAAHRVERHVDRVKGGLGAAFDGARPLRIASYRGYGTTRRALFRGRVLRGASPPPIGSTATPWEAFLAILRHLESDEVPGARLRLVLPGLEVEAVADDEGFFQVEVDLAEAVPPGHTWCTARVELLWPRQQDGAPVEAAVHALVPPASARFVVVSDIDDTIVRTDVRQRLRMARNVLMGTAHTRLPFPGAAALCRALHAGGGADRNPLVYLSSSPWNLHDLLSRLFQRHYIPIGPVLVLRDWGLDESGRLPTDNADHKLGHLRHLLATWPDLPFLLVGDSGQEDPEIYRQVVADEGARILGVYIRDVDFRDERRRAVEALAAEVERRGSSLVLAADSAGVAVHAARAGWILPEAVAEVRAAQRDDGAGDGGAPRPASPAEAADRPAVESGPQLVTGRRREPPLGDG